MRELISDIAAWLVLFILYIIAWLIGQNPRHNTGPRRSLGGGFQLPYDCE